MTTLTSLYGQIEFGEGFPTLLINDSLMIRDDIPQVLDELRDGKIEAIVDQARRGKKYGLNVVNILISHQDVDEVNLLPCITKTVMEDVGCFVCLDSRNPDALEATFHEMRPYKLMINSVTAEPESMDIMLPMAAKYHAALIVMPMGLGEGIPNTVEERLEAAKTVIKRAEGMGISRDDLVIDGMVLATAVEPDSMIVTLETLRALVDELNVTTILGIENAGHFMPLRTAIDMAFLISAIPWGMHAAQVNPDMPGLLDTVLAADFLNNRDPYGKRLISYYRSTRARSKSG